MDYQFAGDFSKAPLGPFTEANKRLVWPGLSYDADKTGKYYEIVEDARFPGGVACRMKYTAGSYGMNDQFYQIRIKSPQNIANLEWYWLFEDGFSFANDPAKQHGGGKTSPCVQWGEVGGATEKRGTRCMIWWGANGQYYTKPVYNPACQDQRSGGQLVQPVVYSAPIVTEQLYKFRIQMIGGPQGFAKYWLDDEPLAEVPAPKNMMATATDDVLYDFAFFSGGGSAIYAPTHDSFGRHGGVRYWSGEAYWSGDQPAPIPPQPEPAPGASFTISIDGKRYLVTGNWKLDLQE